MTRTIMMVLALMVVPLLMATSDRGAVAQTSYCATEAEAAMLQRINALRQDHGLAPLTLSQPLGAAADLKASDMAEREYLAHVSPDGQTPRELLDSVGYTYNTSTGENLAAGNAGATAAFQQWLNSDDHFEIMLGEQYTAIGIGRAHNPDSRYGWYWAAEFGGVVGEPAATCGNEPPGQTPTEAIVAALIAILVEIIAGQAG